MWSLGVIGYILLCGKLPFQNNNNRDDLISRVMKGEYSFNDDSWNNISCI